MARILVVEDEPSLARSLRIGLEDELHVVEVEHDGQEALFRALAGEFDLIVLDRMLPRFSGDDICRRLRLDGVAVPILMLTARDTTRDVVAGLDGALDGRTWSGMRPIEVEGVGPRGSVRRPSRRMPRTSFARR
jgi:two-component system, OmpR family, copper resistance phosphate regulon response regulator CusR